MKCYVLGAGVSCSVGYPLGSQLLDALDKYVGESGSCIDRLDYREDWRNLREWLAGNPDPTIFQAYQTKNIEHLFTALDFAVELWNDAFASALTARGGIGERRKAQYFEIVDGKVKDYQHYRSILLWVLEHYFAWRHQEDVNRLKDTAWNDLHALGNIIREDDVVITFNYDATIERVLLGQGKWSPKNGYGFELAFQNSRDDETPVELRDSPVLSLHLHGATGWYPRLPILLSGDGGALSPEAFGSAPRNTKISLDPDFLRGLGLPYIDACLPDTMGTQRQVVIHPTFLKDYESDESGGDTLISLWKQAGQALRCAEHTYIIGYSVPKADVAALTLLLTNTSRGHVTIVNKDEDHHIRLGSLFRNAFVAKPQKLDEWLRAFSKAGDKK